MLSFSSYMTAVLQKDARLEPSRLIDLPNEDRMNLLVTLPSPEVTCGNRYSDSVWIWPESLYPSLTPSHRRVDFTIPVNLSALGGVEIQDSVKSYLLACLFHPIRQRLSLSAVRKRQRIITEFAGSVLRKTSCKRFVELDSSSYHSLVESEAAGRKNHNYFLRFYLDEMREYGRRGLLLDYPGGKLESTTKAERGAPSHGSRSAMGYNTDQDQDDDNDESDHRSWLPLPDEYVAEMGARSLFYLNEIGPNLVRLFQQSPDQEPARTRWMPIGRGGNAPKADTIKTARTKAWKQCLEQFRWFGSDGAELAAVPFECDELVFPPIKLVDVQRLVSRHQDALLQILLLLSGGRRSEIITIERKTISDPSCKGGQDPWDARDVGVEYGLMVGHTIKPSPRAQGDKRDWPIPIQVMGWLENQANLATILAERDNPYLWVGLSTVYKGGFRIDPYGRCKNFAIRHHIDHLLEEGSVAHPHRFRKTIARLALLALTGAPAIVMQMFGHNDITTTLQYLLSDPNIREDMRIMLGERRAEMGVEIAEKLDDCAGPAADVLRDVRDRFFDELRVPQNERMQKRRMSQFVAAKLEQGGFDLKIVWPGIICVKSLEQEGLCVERGREPNPSKCQSVCRHRLELPLRRFEIRAIVLQILDELDDENGLPRLSGPASI